MFQAFAVGAVHEPRHGGSPIANNARRPADESVDQFAVEIEQAVIVAFELFFDQQFIAVAVAAAAARARCEIRRMPVVTPRPPPVPLAGLTTQ